MTGWWLRYRGSSCATHAGGSSQNGTSEAYSSPQHGCSLAELSSTLSPVKSALGLLTAWLVSTGTGMIDSASVINTGQAPGRAASWCLGGSGWSRTLQPVLLSAGLLPLRLQSEAAAESNWVRRRLSGRGSSVAAASFDRTHGCPRAGSSRRAPPRVSCPGRRERH